MFSSVSDKRFCYWHASATIKLVCAGIIVAPRRMVSAADHSNSDSKALKKRCMREAAVKLVESGMSIKAAALASQVHRSSVQRWVNLKRSGKSLNRKPGSGGIAKLSAAQIKLIKSISKQTQFRSAQRAAREFKRVTGIKICKTTAYRALISGGDRFWLTKKQPRLSDLHKQRRIDFSNTEAYRDWDLVMFTDSKYFQLHSNSKRHGVYGKQPAISETPKFGPSLHIYMGVTRRGLTELKVVSGGSTKNKTYQNRNSIFYKGVSAAEYQAEVLPMFQREGERLFSDRRRNISWVLQQDGAPSHTASESRRLAQSTAPGGMLPNWPPNSPDLSLIENVWGIMAQELTFLPPPENVKELLDALNKIRAAIKPQVLVNMFDGMSARLDKCIALGGAILTK